MDGGGCRSVDEFGAMNCVLHCLNYNEMCLRHKWNPFSSPTMIVSHYFIITLMCFLFLFIFSLFCLSAIWFLLPDGLAHGLLHAKWIPHSEERLELIILSNPCRPAKQNNQVIVWAQNWNFKQVRVFCFCSGLILNINLPEHCLSLRFCLSEF